ncbi:hypothetical protein [Actinokineospora sp.]|uniref:hypothetical protein n=1 Tax=Actinokineospora sp. TaxID=1872133 RepID=UPI004037FC4D
MVTAVLVWIGIVLGLGLLLVMAIGPVIVDLDAKLYERKHNRTRAARQAEVGAAEDARAARRRPMPAV